MDILLILSLTCSNCGSLNEKGANLCGEHGKPIQDFNKKIEAKKSMKLEKKIESKTQKISNYKITSLIKPAHITIADFYDDLG